MSTINISFNNINFIPSPSISINTEYLTLGSGISKIHTINLNGLLYNCKSPQYSGLSGIIQHEQFTTGILNINTSGGDTYNYFVKLVNSNLEPTNDNWSSTIRYSISFEGVKSGEDPNFNTNTNWLVSKIQDEWSIEPLDDNFKTITEPDFDTNLYTEHLVANLYRDPSPRTKPIFKITRTIGAVGRYEVNYTNVLDNAKKWVDNYINTNEGKPSNILSNFNSLYNHVKNINKSVTDGSYTITDTWIANIDNNYTQTLNIEDSLEKDAIRTITINGEIKGLSNATKAWTDPGASGLIKKPIEDYNIKYTNALNRYNNISSSFISIAENMLVKSNRNSSMVYDGVFKFTNGGDSGFYRNETSKINPIPLSSGITHNKTDGSIKFNIIFNNRPINYFGGISENIRVQDSIGMKKIVTQLVLYGPPVLQDLGSKSSNTRNIRIDAKFPNDPTVQSTIDYYNNLLVKRNDIKILAEKLNPANVLAGIVSPNLDIKSFLKDGNSTINVIDNSVSYSLTYEWVFQGK